MSKHEHIPNDLKDLYEIHEYRHAGAILACEFPEEAAEKLMFKLQVVE